MSELDTLQNQITVVAKELRDLATEWQGVDRELRDQILSNQLRQVDFVIDAWIKILGIKKEWDDTLHPADVLDNYIFPELAERLKRPQLTP